MSQADDDEKKRSLNETLNVLRSSSSPNLKAVPRPAKIPKMSEPATPANDDDWREAVRRIEDRQVKVVDLLVATIETNQEVIEKVDESMREDERVRLELVAARGGYRKMRVAVYSLAAAFAVGVGLDVYSDVQTERSRVASVKKLDERMTTVESNTDRSLRVLLKQAATHAANVEAEATLDGNDADKALEQAVELQEEVAKAQIDVAKARKQAPPPEAKKALKRAVEKKQRLRKPVQIEIPPDK